MIPSGFGIFVEVGWKILGKNGRRFNLWCLTSSNPDGGILVFDIKAISTKLTQFFQTVLTCQLNRLSGGS